MFTFNVFGFGKFQMSIEHPTHLLLLEQVVKGEEFPRYIRMTGQQCEKFRKILFSGNFTSTTIPRNNYRLDTPNKVVHITCYEEHQQIDFPIEGWSEFDNYYKKHKDHIEKYDARFRSMK